MQSTLKSNCNSNEDEGHLPLFVEPSVFDVNLGAANEIIAANLVFIKNTKFTERIAWNVSLLEI